MPLPRAPSRKGGHWYRPEPRRCFRRLVAVNVLGDTSRATVRATGRSYRPHRPVTAGFAGASHLHSEGFRTLRERRRYPVGVKKACMATPEPRPRIFSVPRTSAPSPPSEVRAAAGMRPSSGAKGRQPAAQPEGPRIGRRRPRICADFDRPPPIQEPFFGAFLRTRNATASSDRQSDDAAVEIRSAPRQSDPPDSIRLRVTSIRPDGRN